MSSTPFFFDCYFRDLTHNPDLSNLSGKFANSSSAHSADWNSLRIWISWSICSFYGLIKSFLITLMNTVIFWQNVVIRSITTFVPNLKTARPEKNYKFASTPFLLIFFSFTPRWFFLVNPRVTGTPKLLDELPKIANWYLSRSSIIGGEYVRECALLAFWPLDNWGKWVSSMTSLGDFCVESGCTLAVLTVDG